MRNKLLEYKFEPQEMPPELEPSIRQIFDAYKDDLVKGATRAEARAEHWNKSDPTMVGCAILLVGKDFDLSQPSIHFGANSKPEPGMLPYPLRKCAEMQALEGALNIDREQKNGGNGKSSEPVEQGDLGVVVAVVTTSRNRNTGEAETKGEHVVDSCKQCMSDYEILKKVNRVSDDTIIYNVRLEDGKPVAGEIKRLGPLLKKFRENQPIRIENSIKDLLQVRDEMVRAFLQAVSGTEKQLYKELEERLSQLTESIRREALKEVKNFELLEEQKAQIHDLQREIREGVFAKAETLVYEYSNRILMAMLSAFEEGASKKQIITRLGLENTEINELTEGFDDEDQKLIREKLAEYLMAALANDRQST
jgi:hypothetical protein